MQLPGLDLSPERVQAYRERAKFSPAGQSGTGIDQDSHPCTAGNRREGFITFRPDRDLVDAFTLDVHNDYVYNHFHHERIEGMHELYDVGYLTLKQAEVLKRAAVALDAVVLDVRFSPKSMDPQWRKNALAELLGDRYEWCQALGNKNYKGGDIEFADLKTGLERIAELLETRSVILMCACWNRPQCHRTVIAFEYEQQHGVKSIEITGKKMVEELISEQAAENQPGLFDNAE
jgi:hypothetical protein